MIYKARTPEQWDHRAALNVAMGENLTEQQALAIAECTRLMWLDFLDGWWTKGEEIHFYDCQECLRELDEQTFSAAQSAEYIRAAEFYEPELWDCFVAVRERRPLTTQQKETLRLHEVERALDGEEVRL